MEHALRCQELTQQHRSEMKDFDIFMPMRPWLGYSHYGKIEEAKQYKILASEQAQKIADAEDKKIVMGI